jgi:hypothetical protein
LINDRGFDFRCGSSAPQKARNLFFIRKTRDFFVASLLAMTVEEVIIAGKGNGFGLKRKTMRRNQKGIYGRGQISFPI